MDARRFQEQLAAQIRGRFRKEGLSEPTLAAFFAMPRHRFVTRFRATGTDTWHTIDESTLPQHLSSLYADQPIVTHGERADLEERGSGGGGPVSTMSQPSFVLWLLDQLDVQPGQRVFELGTGTGWNAALLAHLVGPEGRVITSEIIEPIATQARAHLRDLPQVEVVAADGGDGHPPSAPYDRAIFTAGAFDLPLAFHHQLAPGAKLLFVLKNRGGTDTLLRLERRQRGFEATMARLSAWVPMTGRYAAPAHDTSLAHLAATHDVDLSDTRQEAFQWGADPQAGAFPWTTAGMRSFLSLHAPFTEVTLASSESAFGWALDGSLAVGSPGTLACYGTNRAKDELLATLHRWIQLGMPTLTTMHLEVHPSDEAPPPQPDTWIWRRPQSTFVWSVR